MERLRLVFVGLLIVLANLAFFYFAIPDSLPARLVASVLGQDAGSNTGNSTGLNLTFECKEPLPEFTLGPESSPTEKEIDELCACVWRELPNAARQFAELLADDPSKARSETAVNAFAANFGLAMQRCGAENI